MRERKNHSADFLVCFPSRVHLALAAPKPICSPSRPNEPTNRLRNHNHQNHRCRRLSKLSGGQASPMLWAKPSNHNSVNSNNKQMGAEIDSEPTSPKVTCAGQIKVRPRSDGHNPCKNWQTVMEEIERIHKSRSRSRTFGFKKDVLNFLSCLRKVKFDFRCFGSFPQTDIITDDEAEEDDDDEEIEEEEEEEEDEKSRTVFSKWFMVLQENQSEENEDGKFQRRDKKQRSFDLDNSGGDDSSFVPAVPPPNALLLMRCRSAPAKSWLENKKEEEEEKENKKQEEEEEKTEEEMNKNKKKKDLRSLMAEERLIQKENVVLMRYDADFYKLSGDIAKETWVVGGIKNPLPRTLSLKR